MTGPFTAPPPAAAETAATVSVDDLATLLEAPDNRPLVLDLEPASPYVHVRHHIPGSVVARRSSLHRTLAPIGEDTEIVFTSGDGRLALIAAAEYSDRRVRALAGGTAAWRESGRPVGAGADQEALDPSERIPEPLTLEQRRTSLDWYVNWGDEIVAELERDGLVSFVD